MLAVHFLCSASSRMMEYSLDGHNASLSAIRTVRVLRPLRAINRVPSKCLSCWKILIKWYIYGHWLVQDGLKILINQVKLTRSPWLSCWGSMVIRHMTFGLKHAIFQFIFFQENIFPWQQQTSYYIPKKKKKPSLNHLRLLWPGFSSRVIFGCYPPLKDIVMCHFICDERQKLLSDLWHVKQRSSHPIMWWACVQERQLTEHTSL